MSDQFPVEVVYGVPNRQSLVSLVVTEGTNVEQAIEQSGILNIYKEIDLTNNKVGIWNRTCKLSDPLKIGDRIEIYRPLVADPKEVRKRRALRAKEEGRANKTTGAKMAETSNNQASQQNG